MKQFPTSNFPVKADPLAAWNDEVPWDLFDGAFHVRLNLSVPLVFVPFVGVEFLDPAAELPGDWEQPTTPAQAFLYGMVGSRYVVTASETEAGVGAFEDRVVFFVTPADYEALARELEAISDHPSRAGQPLSQLAGQQLTRLLAETIIPALPEDDRYWLTDR